MRGRKTLGLLDSRRGPRGSVSHGEVWVRGSVEGTAGGDVVGGGTRECLRAIREGPIFCAVPTEVLAVPVMNRGRGRGPLLHSPRFILLITPLVPGDQQNPLCARPETHVGADTSPLATIHGRCERLADDALDEATDLSPQSHTQVGRIVSGCQQGGDGLGIMQRLPVRLRVLALPHGPSVSVSAFFLASRSLNTSSSAVKSGSVAIRSLTVLMRLSRSASSPSIRSMSVRIASPFVSGGSRSAERNWRTNRKKYRSNTSYRNEVYFAPSSPRRAADETNEGSSCALGCNDQ